MFATAFSLAALSGPLSNGFQLPSVLLAHANLPPCVVVGASGACSGPWYPAGPEMNTEFVDIFSDVTAEYTAIHSFPPPIDFSDTPCQPAICSTMSSDPGFLVTAPVALTAYYEIEFHLANTFWNCSFSFGNSACGVQIRQAFAHMLDKSSFCSNSVLAGVCTPLDRPVPTSSGGGLPSPNPCAYDAQNSQSGTNCIVGAPGGTAYHLLASTGANGSPWLYAPGSPDLNAAAQHLVNAGVATGFNNKTSVLTGAVTTNAPTFFTRTDDPARKQLGESLQSQLCYLFTGLYTAPCLPFVNSVEGPIIAFPGFATCNQRICLNWWIYTAAFDGVQFFDDSLYHVYNSRFVSGFPGIQPPSGPCSPQSVSTGSGANYMYLCNPAYDSISSQIEFAPCLKAQGDPAIGASSNFPTSPGNGICNGVSTGPLSAISAGIQAEATFGANAFTIPVFERTAQFGYLNGWTRVINADGSGLPNYFTWLNAYNPNPAIAGTIRQGFSETTRSLNPYIASTTHDSYIFRNIYDSLSATNPLDLSQSINWMTYRVVQLDNATLIGTGGYNPPPGTLTTYRFVLRNDVFFQDGRPVTAYDVAFSYLSLVGSGAAFGIRASSVTGITVIGPRVFDIGVNSLGQFTLSNLSNTPIIPGRYWSGAGTSGWDNAVMVCTTGTPCSTSQYALSGATVTCPAGVHPGCSSFAANLMQVDPAKTTATYDPILNGILIGSGPWACRSNTGVLGAACSSSQSPPQPGGSFTLTRYGCTTPANCLLPASSTSGIYFRSSGDLALYIWSQENDVSAIQSVSFVAVCFGQPVNPSSSCAHWQHGIGASSTGIVGINQVSAVELRYNLNWISPFEWTTNPPLGIGAFPPVLYEGPVTLNPCSVDSVNGYDC